LFECKKDENGEDRNGIYLKGGLRDADDNEYEAVLIGTQVWMAENLKTEVEGGVCYGENVITAIPDVEANCDDYGRLYYWATAMGIEASYNTDFYDNLPTAANPHQGICPDGWHLPSNDEFQVLLDFVGADALNKLKIKSGSVRNDGSNFWTSGDTGTDDYGFRVLPGGFYTSSSSSSYYGLGSIGRFLSSTNRISSSGGSSVYNLDVQGTARIASYSKNEIHSVRCLKNAP
jgi:uncharacterized protein (TIGR02145 family)